MQGFVAKPRTPQLIAQRVQLFKAKGGNVNFLWVGLREGYLFFEKRYPSLARAAQRAATPAPLEGG